MTAIGREEQLRYLDAALVDGAVVAVVGPSGVGKSVLAATWAEQRPDEVLFVDCFGLQGSDVLRALGAAVGLEDVQSLGESMIWGQLADRFERFAAIVLDDFGAELRWIDDLRARAGLPLLVTAHAVPDVSEVTVLPVEPFAIREPDAFVGSPAHTLFVRTARAVDLRYEEGDPNTIREIVEMTGGLPLGIVLAARRAATFGAAEALRLMRSDVHATTDPRRPARHRTLADALAFSWGQLGDDDRRRMFAMALFARPLRPSLIAEICEEDLADTLEGIGGLVQRGHVTRGPYPRPLEVLVDVARESFDAESPTEAASMRARIRGLAVERAQELPRGLRSSTRFGEGPSLWQYVVDSGELDELQPADLGAVLAAWAKWVRLVPRDERRALDRIEEHLDHANDWHAWLSAARTRMDNDMARAAELARRAVDAAQTDQELREASDLLGHCLAGCARHPQAADVFAEAEHHGENTALTAYYRAKFYNETGQPELAAAMMAEAERLVDPDDLSLRAVIAFQAAWCEPSARDSLRSIRLARELFSEIGLTSEVAEAEMGLAELTVFHGGGLDDAIEACRRAEQARRRIHDEGGAFRVKLQEAHCRTVGHDPEGADRLLREIRARGVDAMRVSETLVTLYEAVVAWQLQQLDLAETKRQVLRDAGQDFAEFAARRKALLVLDVGLALAAHREHDAQALVSNATESEELTASLCAMLAVAAAHAADSTGTQLQSWGVIRPCFDTENSLSLSMARGFVQARLTPLQRRLRAIEAVEADVVTMSDFAVFRTDGDWVDLSDHPTTSALLEALVSAAEPLSFEALGALLYPAEEVRFDALQNRINVQMSKLRKLGLKPFIAKEPDGFVLRGTAHVEPATDNEGSLK